MKYINCINMHHHHHPQIFLLSLPFLFIISSTVLAHEPDKISLVAPITKDTNTSLHRITLNYVEKYVIDLGAPFLWRYCQFPLSPIPCSSPQCQADQSYKCPLPKTKPKNGKCT